MNGIKYLLDTCFILELYNGNHEVLQKIANIHLSQCAISTINKIEVLGFKHLSQQDSDNLTLLLSHFHKITIDEATESKVIELRKRHQIKLPDGIILATALNHNLELLTLDNGLMNKYIKETET